MKRFITFLTVFALLLVSVAAVGAQDDTATNAPPMWQRDRLPNMMDTVLEITGLTVEDIQAGIAEGQTLAEVIEANGGNVEEVRQALVDAGLATFERNLTERVDMLLAHELGNRMPINGRSLQIAQYVLDVTGLTVEDIQAGAQAGQTLAELIEANGGDVAAITAELNAAAAQQFPNVDADTLATRIDTLLNTVLGSRMPNNGRGLQIAQYVLDVTGLTVEDIQAGAQAGQTLAELIEANGGDVAAITAELNAAAAEQFPNVDADTLANRIDAMLNHELGSMMRGFDGGFNFFGPGNMGPNNMGPGGRGRGGKGGGRRG